MLAMAKSADILSGCRRRSVSQPRVSTRTTGSRLVGVRLSLSSSDVAVTCETGKQQRRQAVFNACAVALDVLLHANVPFRKRRHADREVEGEAHVLAAVCVSAAWALKFHRPQQLLHLCLCGWLRQRLHK